MTASEAPLVLAVPSKGRLQENAIAFFARAGLEFVQGRGARDYRGAILDQIWSGCGVPTSGVQLPRPVLFHTSFTLKLAATAGVEPASA